VTESPYITEPIAHDDPASGFRCGVPALDNFSGSNAELVFDGCHQDPEPDTDAGADRDPEPDPDYAID
jgi:hypothetical protein